MGESDSAWNVFAALHGEASPQTIDRSLASDEALDAVLAEIAGATPSDLDLIRKRYSSLCRNRFSKQKNRRALDRRRFRETHRRGGREFGGVLLTAPMRTIVEQLAYQQMVGLIRTVLTEDEVALLFEIADSGAYADLANDRSTTVSSVKSKAFRIREKVRNSGVAAMLHHGLRR